ncbi:tetraacyldisaccharide 4'-kinase, partial [Leptospira interrogans]|uniref:tetraacyldisaccharide 4'-kinase n=1 Tax=Leptospira interrogans TaxID=173 RepID=UPI003CFE5130
MNSFSTLSILQIILFPILYVFSFLYRALFLLDQKLTKKKKLPGAFVISVGNLSMGGTGKTPFSIFLAKLIHKKFPDQKIIILSRGYNAKGSLRGHRVGPHSTPMEAGDEPLLLKKHLPFAEVWIGKDRYSSYIHFREELRMRENSIVILDDGFQHHVLERDVDLVLLDSSKISKERFLIPAGNLREPISSLIRADQIIFSKYESSIEKIVQNIQNKFSKEILRFSLEPDKLLSPNLQSDSPKILSGKKVYAFTGIGNPEVFFSMIRKFEPLKLENHSSAIRSLFEAVRL